MCTTSRLDYTQSHAGLSSNSSVLSNTAHSGRRVLRSGGPNHTKPAVFIVFLSEIELILANPRVLTLWAEAGAFRHPAVVCHTAVGTSGLGYPLLLCQDSCSYA